MGWQRDHDNKEGGRGYARCGKWNVPLVSNWNYKQKQCAIHFKHSKYYSCSAVPHNKLELNWRIPSIKTVSFHMQKVEGRMRTKLSGPSLDRQISGGIRVSPCFHMREGVRKRLMSEPSLFSRNVPWTMPNAFEFTRKHEDPGPLFVLGVQWWTARQHSILFLTFVSPTPLFFSILEESVLYTITFWICHVSFESY